MKFTEFLKEKEDTINEVVTPVLRNFNNSLLDIRGAIRTSDKTDSKKNSMLKKIDKGRDMIHDVLKEIGLR